MRTTSLIWIVVGVIIVVIAGWYLWSGGPSMQSGATATTTASGAAGINGSPNQGNLGGTDTGSVQQPGADGAEGSIIGSNLALGLDLGSSAGAHLIGYTGMTVYTYDKDSTGTSTCYAQCAQNWPPYIAGPEDNLTQLQAGVNGTVGTITRVDGSLQVTYNGLPLYFYAGDTTGSDVNGNGVGGVWHVVKP